MYLLSPFVNELLINLFLRNSINLMVKMSEHGAALQTYNQELVKCLEDLKERRKEINNVINNEEREINSLESNIKTLHDKLVLLNKNLTYHKTLKDGYDRTITDTEAGFKKILEGSQTLLNLVQTEVAKLNENTKKMST